jgi:hypothetical protein
MTKPASMTSSSNPAPKNAESQNHGTMNQSTAAPSTGTKMTKKLLEQRAREKECRLGNWLWGEDRPLRNLETLMFEKEKND